VTAAQLLSYITVALLLQLVAGAAFAVWRRPTTAGARTPVEVEQGIPSGETPSGAWSGWRDFRVVRRDFEDVAQTQCSFQLQPVDGAPLKPFQPGQYLTFSLKVPGDVVGVAGAAVGDRTITRCYSLSDRPDCPRRSKSEPPRRPNIEPGVEADFERVGCG
jgi:hypothetical protein